MLGGHAASLIPDDETFAAFLDRIAPKAGLQQKDVQTLKEGKDGSSLVYEYEGERYSLEDGSSALATG